MSRAALCLMCLCSLAPAQDSAGFRGAARDGKLAGFKAPATWPDKLQKGWSVGVGGGHSTPALVEGRLYAHARQGEDEVVLCLEAESGKEVWKDTYAAPYTPDPTAKTHGKGPFSSPSVAGGRVFTFGISGVLSCLDAKTGRVIWRQDFRDKFPVTYPEWGASMSPLVTGDLCVVHAGGKDKGAIIAFEAATGKPRWSWEGDGPGYASPVVATVAGKAQIITQTQSSAVGLSAADGTLLWQLEYKTNFEQNSITPIVSGDVVILSGYGKGAAAYRLGEGEPKEVWNTTQVSMYMSTAVLKGDRLYGFSEKGKGQLFCMDAKGGEPLWIGDGRLGENASVLDAGDVILALVTAPPQSRKVASNLIVFDASDKEYAERARYKVADGPAWAHPVVSGRSIYVKDEKTLTRWTIP